MKLFNEILPKNVEKNVLLQVIEDKPYLTEELFPR